MSKEKLKEIISNLKKELENKTPEEWTAYIESLPDNEYTYMAQSMVVKNDSDVEKLNLKLAEQSEIIRDLSKHLMYFIGDKRPCYVCESGDEKFGHSSFCQAQHALSYSSKFEEEK